MPAPRGGQYAQLFNNPKTKELTMKSNSRKDTLFNSAVLLAAWLVVIGAGVSDQVETSAQVVQIAYPVY